MSLKYEPASEQVRGADGRERGADGGVSPPPVRQEGLRQPTPYLANRRPILPTDVLSCQLPPYPANRRPIQPTHAI